MKIKDRTVLQHSTPVNIGGKSYGSTTRGAPGVSGLMHRGVVVEVIYPDQAKTAQTDTPERNAVTCKVLAYGNNGKARLLNSVPVLQTRHGLNNADIWVPRPSTTDLSGEPFRLQPDESGEASNWADLDGDHVIIGYLDNDFTQPIILGSVGHPQTNRKLTSADGDVRRIYHAGVLVEIDKNGNVTIDATEGNNQTIDEDGNETPVGGNITLKTDAGKKIFFDVGNASDSAVIFSKLKAWADDLFIWEQTHTHPTALGTSGPTVQPPPLFPADIESTKIKIPND